MFYLTYAFLILLQFYLLGIAINAIYYSLIAYESEEKLDSKEYLKNSVLWGLVVINKLRKKNKNELRSNF